MHSVRVHTHTLHTGTVTSHTTTATHILSLPHPLPLPPPTHLSVARIVALNGECCPLLPLTLGSDHALLALQAQQTHNTIPPRAREARGAHLTTDTQHHPTTCYGGPRGTLDYRHMDRSHCEHHGRQDGWDTPTPLPPVRCVWGEYGTSITRKR